MNKHSFSLSGTIIDVVNHEIFTGVIHVKDGHISSIHRQDEVDDQYILPGLIDAHIHIESSMLTPSSFAKQAVIHGTIGTVSDPHEIANVNGLEGVKYMIENGKTVPFKFFFGAPSCVPATSFETSGATINSDEIDSLLSSNEIKYLSEMMNYPGVIYNDAEVMAKLESAKKHHKPIDGHAPGLKGDALSSYAEAGITTDHECFTIEEALDKINLGMKVQIREGSAAKNYEALSPLLNTHPSQVMLCSDDKHPDDLVIGHINKLIQRAIADGYDLFNILRACTIVPKHHYNLDNGLLQIGDAADIITIDHPDTFNILTTYVNGQKVAEKGESLIEIKSPKIINLFEAEPINKDDLVVPDKGTEIKIIEVFDDQLITGTILGKPLSLNGSLQSDTDQDILKLVVMNRYQASKPQIAFIKNMGLKNGAMASTVAHDSHNIIAVGTTDEDLVNAINAIIETKGGISVVHNDQIEILPLPVAGIMSTQDAQSVATLYQTLHLKAIELGSELKAPFMTLSFMSLLVIPELKLSDKGLFDGTKFQFTNLYVEK